MRSTTALPLLIILALAALLSACVPRSVVHLERQLWAMQKTQTLKMTFLRFEYKAVKIDGNSGSKAAPCRSWTRCRIGSAG